MYKGSVRPWSASREHDYEIRQRQGIPLVESSAVLDELKVNLRFTGERVTRGTTKGQWSKRTE